MRGETFDARTELFNSRVGLRPATSHPMDPISHPARPANLTLYNFEETFAPVAKFASIRIILSIVAQHNLVLHQMDVKTAFLNSLLE